MIATTVFEGLVDMGVKLSKSFPAVAKAWRIAQDWSYIEFDSTRDQIPQRRNPLTAEDVKFSMETHMRPELKQALGATYNGRIKNIEVLGAYKSGSISNCLRLI